MSAPDLSHTLSFDSPYAGPKRARKRHRPGLHAEGSEIQGLNLTAMMDMMTILLVFLVKSYAVEPERITINDNLRPPASTSQEEMKPAVTITVTSEAIMVDEKVIMNLKDIDPKDLDAAFLSNLQNELLSQAELQKRIKEASGQKFDGALLLVAHEDTPYSILTTVLYTAGIAQFSQFRLLVMKKALYKK